MVPKKYLCPDCGGEPRGVAETIPGTALVAFDEEGRPFYEGGTDVHWDGGSTDRQPETGEIMFVCHDGHSYSVAGVTEID